MEEFEGVSSEGCNEFSGTPLPSNEDKATAEDNNASSRPKSHCHEYHSNPTKLRKPPQERIDRLRSTTFMVSDSTALENAIKTVADALLELQKVAKHENGLPLCQSPAKQKLQSTQVDYHTKPFLHADVTKSKRERGIAVDLGKDDNTPKDNIVESKEVGRFLVFVSQTLQR